MNSGSGDGAIYAVIVICLVALLSLIACLGLRIIKRSREPHNVQQQPPSSLRQDEWQQLRSVVTPLDSADESTLQAVNKWQLKYPPNTNSFLDVTKQPEVIDKGVKAWKFIETETTADNEEESNAAIMDSEQDTITFCQGTGSIMTNLPVPMQEFSYYEVKVLQLNNQDRLAIGFATKPYPRWRLPGWHRHSVAYHSNSGAIFASDPVYGRPYGPPYKQGDVIGVGYLYQSGTVFYTRNGQNLGKASIGFKYPSLYPIIGSVGPCHVSTNFGLEDFLFTPANQREAAYAPKQGSLLPPPAYGVIDDTVLFQEDDQQQCQQQQQYGHGEHLMYVDHTSSLIQPPPPSYS